MTIVFMSLLATTIGERISMSIGQLLFLPTAHIVAMIGSYCLAKLLEVFDHQLGAVLSTGGHPWKHIAAAFAMLCYVTTISRRESIFMVRLMTISQGQGQRHLPESPRWRLRPEPKHSYEHTLS